MWETTKLYDKDDAALDTLSDILTGSKNGRLFKSLVFEKQIAQDVASFQYSGVLTGMFIIIATAKPGVDLDKLKKEIMKELKQIEDEGITSDELERSKNAITSSFIYSLQNINSLVDQINNYNTNLGEPNSFISDMERMTRLNLSEVNVMIDAYLNKPFVELQIIPKEVEVETE